MFFSSLDVCQFELINNFGIFGWIKSLFRKKKKYKIKILGVGIVYLAGSLAELFRNI
jgi:hypothetical protein